MQDNFQSNATGYNNALYNSVGVVQTRLNTDAVIAQFDTYLRGIETTVVQDQNGELVNKIVWQGKPIVNESGYQAIMQFINLVINAQTVQGNFLDEDYYGEYLCRLRKELTTDLMINRKRYGIDPRDFPGLMSRLMRIIEVFMTRPIQNGERNSYAATFKSIESLQTNPNKSSIWSTMNLMGGKK